MNLKLKLAGSAFAAALFAVQAGAAPFSSVGSTGISDADAGSFTALVNPNATDEAKGLMRYLSAIYGKGVLSGHQTSYTIATADDELSKIKGWTGEAPALRGFDFMDVINSWGAPHADSALAWAKRTGGVLSLCWHWRLGGASFNNATAPWYPETDATVNADLKKLGDQLQRFADAKIPVLWRPLHEPPGKWFWWHTNGADIYKRLWKHMYDYLVNERKINNLIWVYSASDGGTSSTDWYPGNDYVDIMGVDGYGEQWQTYWNGLWSMTGGGKKMQAMTENKKFPGWNTDTPWLWTLCWNNEIFNALSDNDFKTFYNNAATINIDDLPTYNGKATWAAMLPHASALSSSGTAKSSSSAAQQASSASTGTSSAAASGDFVTIEDFNDAATSQTTLGAALGLARHAGYWYGYIDTDHGGTTTMTPDVINDDTQLAKAVTDCGSGDQCLHITFDLGDGYAYPFAGVGFNLLDAGESVDLSSMTKFTFRAKGTGTLRFKFMTSKVTDGYPKGSNWGDMGVDIKLTSEWKTYVIEPKDILPQAYSAQATDKLTWNDCKDKVQKIHLATGTAMTAGQKLDLYIDDMVMEGVTLKTFGGDATTKLVQKRATVKLNPARARHYDLLGRRR